MELANLIEHTVLSADCSMEAVQKCCTEAIEHNFHGVCIPPFHVSQAVKLLENHPQKVITVVGFPMGYSATPAKVEEVKRAIDEGADEIDVVVNIAAVKSKNWAYVRNDIDSLTRAVHLRGKIIKVILENALMTKEELVHLCDLCTELEVNYVKTATGFNEVATTPEVIRFLNEQTGDQVKVKASGGIKTREQALALIEAGASRLGASKGLKIIEL